MNKYTTIGLSKYDISSPLNKSFTTDITLDLESNLLDIIKIFVKGTGLVENIMLNESKHPIGFLNGTLSFRIEYLNTENNIVLKDFNRHFSEELDLSLLLGNSINKDVNLYCDIQINDLFLQKTESMIYIATLSTIYLDLL